MTELLLPEELFLLAHDDESGKESGALALTNSLGGAIPLDFAAGELLVSKDGKLAATPGTTAHPLLVEAHTVRLAEDGPPKADRLINRLARAMKPLGTKVGESLADRGILGEEGGQGRAQHRAKDIAAHNAAVTGGVAKAIRDAQDAVLVGATTVIIVAGSS